MKIKKCDNVIERLGLDRLRDKYLHLSRGLLPYNTDKNYKLSHSFDSKCTEEIEFPKDVIGIKGVKIEIERVTNLKTEGDVEIRIGWKYDIGHTELSMERAFKMKTNS